MTPEQFSAARATLAQTQVSLGRHIGITARQIARYENGATKVPQSIAVLMDFLIRREKQKNKRAALFQKRKMANAEIAKKYQRAQYFK
jgi:transcriptional regulator with XRE-family HTH domain